MPGKTLLNPKVNRYQPADSARYGRTSDGLSVVALLYGLRVELDMIKSGVGEFVANCHLCIARFLFLSSLS
jgi:hypothetical protein